MGNLNINGSISSRYAMKIDDNGFVKGFGLIDSAALKPLPILSMIEQRIRDDVEPQVKLADNDLTAIISIELRKLGINPSLTNMHQFASGIADKYRERLVCERIAAIVDGLVGEKPVKADDTIAHSEFYSKAVADGTTMPSIITVTMPPNASKEQCDKIKASIKGQLPADTQLVSTIDGVVLGRL